MDKHEESSEESFEILSDNSITLLHQNPPKLRRATSTATLGNSLFRAGSRRYPPVAPRAPRPMPRSARTSRTCAAANSGAPEAPASAFEMTCFYLINHSGTTELSVCIVLLLCFKHVSPQLTTEIFLVKDRQDRQLSILFNGKVKESVEEEVRSASSAEF